MTMDGAIAADFITTGTINGALIKADSIKAASLSQEYKQIVTDSINDVEISVTQAFQVADWQLSSTITKEVIRAESAETNLSSSILQTEESIKSEASATYLTKDSAVSTYATKSSLMQTVDSYNIGCLSNLFAKRLGFKYLCYKNRSNSDCKRD